MTDHIQGQKKMPKKFIHVAHKNFLTVKNNEKKCPEPTFHGEVPGKHGGIGDAVTNSWGQKYQRDRSVQL
jgi:hypothetical protein